eukprot:COSAG01_NODE_55849_length_322_cov_0.919283_1_plen_30_part_01
MLMSAQFCQTYMQRTINQHRDEEQQHSIQY